MFVSDSITMYSRVLKQNRAHFNLKTNPVELLVLKIIEVQLKAYGIIAHYQLAQFLVQSWPFQSSGVVQMTVMSLTSSGDPPSRTSVILDKQASLFPGD